MQIHFGFRLLARLGLLTLGLSAVASSPALAQSAACSQFFAGGQAPLVTNARLAQRTTLLCNDAFAVLASGITRGAIWSAERPTAASVTEARNTVRESEFYPDPRLPAADQAKLDDYRGSGYDRGHMAPSGDMPGSQAQQQSFSLANMVPQTPQLNRDTWERIERAVRELAIREGELYVVTGAAFQGRRLRSIGPNGVLVPSVIWKAVYDPRAQGAGAYMCTNSRRPHCRTVSIATLTGMAGVDPFPALPAALKAVSIRLSIAAPGRHSARRQNQQLPASLQAMDQ